MNWCTLCLFIHRIIGKAAEPLLTIVLVVGLTLAFWALVMFGLWLNTFLPVFELFFLSLIGLLIFVSAHLIADVVHAAFRLWRECERDCRSGD